MYKTPIAATAIAVIALSGCGSSTSHSAATTAPSTTPATTPTATATSPTTAAPTTNSAYLASFRHVRTIASTVPPNGDMNPYGIVIVPSSAGALHAGDLLISNFNAKSNNQGTGSTIVELTPAGRRTVFATVRASSLPGSCPGGVGLTTALDVLPGGYVVVGSLPTKNGQSATAQFGCLIVLNDAGRPVSTISGPNIQGPWDMTAVTHGQSTSLFVSNVLNGGADDGIHTIDNSTVVRINVTSGPGQPPKVVSQRVVVDKIPWRDDKAALAIGPTGVAVAANGTLYVADTLKSRILAVPQALTRTSPVADSGITLTQGGHLSQPLGLTLAPNGDILTTNAGDGDIVETTPAGRQLVQRGAGLKAGAGSLFGLVPGPDGLYYVDDAQNTVRLLH